MQELLIRRLHHYLENNHPEILIELETAGQVTQYLKQKVSQVDWFLHQLISKEVPPFYIEEACMQELTAEYQPSRYHYVIRIIEKQFEQTLTNWRKMHIHVFETTNIINLCQPLFELYPFREDNSGNPALKIAVSEVIRVYIEKSAQENREVWDTMYSKN